MPEEEITFTGSYKDFKLGVRFPLAGATPADAAHALGFIASRIEEPAFRYSGINIAKIKEYAKPNSTGLQAVISFLESNTQSKIKEAVMAGTQNALLYPAAESFLFNQLLTNAGVDFKITDTIVSSSIVPEEEVPEDMIALTANFKGWVAIKKLGLEDVQDYEVSGILSGIENTIVNKAFDLSGCKKDEELLSKLSGGRKSFSNLINALKGISGSMSGNKPDDAYLVCKAFEASGYRPYASPGMLTNAYPDIKPPKVKGRKPKG